MNCLTTTVINLGHSSIFTANCLDRCVTTDCFWTSDSRKRLRREEEKEDSDGLLSTVTRTSTLLVSIRHSYMKLWGEYDSAPVKWSVASTLLAYSVVSLFSFVQFRSCLHLTWSHINLSIASTVTKASQKCILVSNERCLFMVKMLLLHELFHMAANRYFFIINLSETNLNISFALSIKCQKYDNLHVRIHKITYLLHQLSNKQEIFQ